MIGLGIWQLERREWKAGLIETIDARLLTPPVAMPADLSPEWEFRRVLVQGTVAGGQWFRFPGRSRDGQVGDALMAIVEKDDGGLVAVEYGWIEFGAPLPSVPLALATEGILRQPSQPGWFTPDNNAEDNAWYRVDPAMMAESVGLDPTALASMYVRPSTWQPSLPNDHLQYAITWFSLAGVFCIIFLIFHRRRY